MNRKNKPGATRKFLMSVLVIAGLLGLVGFGFISGIHYQTMLSSSDAGGTGGRKTDEMYFQEGRSFQLDGDYKEALDKYSMIDESWESYDEAEKNIEECRINYSVDMLTQAQELLDHKQKEDALELLCESLQVLGDNDDIKNAIKKIGMSGDNKKIELDLPEGAENYKTQQTSY